jgi:hypothetical protein
MIPVLYNTIVLYINMHACVSILTHMHDTIYIIYDTIQCNAKYLSILTTVLSTHPRDAKCYVTEQQII